MAKISKKKFRKALKDSFGSITTIASRCQVQRNTIYAFIKKYPEMKDDIQEEIDRVKDMAESRMKLLALKDNIKALKFFLERKCGWISKQALEVKSDNKTTIDLSKFENYVKGEKEEKKSGTDSTPSDSESNKK